MPNINTRLALLHFNAWLEMLRESFGRIVAISEDPHFSPILELPPTISPAAASSSSYTSSAVPESNEDIDITWVVRWKQTLDDMLQSDKIAMAPGNLRVLKGALAKISFTEQGLLASLQQALGQDRLMNELAVQNIDDIRVSMNMSDLDVDKSAFGEEFSSRRRVETYRFAIGMARALQNSKRTHLDFHNNEDLFGANSAIVIAEMLKVNGTITHVDLQDQQQIDAGPIAIAEALKVNSTLTTLNLSHCMTRDSWGATADDIAAAIAEALKVNSSVTTLNLSNNIIGDAGAIAIAEALKVNRTLTHVDLRGNNISQSVLNDIERGLARNRDNLQNKEGSLFDKPCPTLFSNKSPESSGSSEEGEVLGNSSSKRPRPDDGDVDEPQAETSSKVPRNR